MIMTASLHVLILAAIGLMKASGSLMPAGFMQKNVTVGGARGITRNHERGETPSLLQ
jgi:hypothetical protein